MSVTDAISRRKAPRKAIPAQSFTARSAQNVVPELATKPFRYQPQQTFAGGAVIQEELPLEGLEKFPGTLLALPTLEKRTATIACIIPAYNEEETIQKVLQSLLDQTRPPDRIFVIVNNTTDDTTYLARHFEGIHQLQVRDQNYQCVVEIHDIGKNSDKKVGALNYGWQLARGYDFLLGVDGDTTLDTRCVEWLEKEMVDDSRIGGISAIYSIDYSVIKGALAKFLVLGQRAQFAGFNMDNLTRNRNMAVLGGQCSLFRMDALEVLRHRYNQETPWVRDSEVEDSYLSLQLKDKQVGYQTKISARARAYVGAMDTINSLHSQQVKWTHGAIELMREQPFHPNLRLRWRENISMLFNIISRFFFVVLLAASLSIDAFVLNLVWLIPPIVAIALNTRIALSMHDKTRDDVLFAVLGFPSELYMWLRINHFMTSWWRSLARVEKDNWALQAAAESGKGGGALLWPLLGLGAATLVLVNGWIALDLYGKSLVLALGWPLLGVVATLLTMFMIKQLTRRQRGFKV